MVQGDKMNEQINISSSNKKTAGKKAANDDDDFYFMPSTQGLASKTKGSGGLGPGQLGKEDAKNKEKKDQNVN